MTRIAVLGAGSWGTALAIHLARGGAAPILWARGDRAGTLAEERENSRYLPGHRLPPSLEVTADLAAALHRTPLVLLVAPAQSIRELLRRAGPHLEPEALLVIASKGIEQATGLRLSQVVQQEIGARAAERATVLSGPSFAAEVARGDPTAVVAAGPESGATRRVQEVVAAGALRVYRNSDRIGVEVAGALKNVMAIATGIAEGIGFGTNTRAALITRGLAEITRLGTALGGRAPTFAGLAGAGDLILTCTGALSRNRSVGLAIGRGAGLEEAIRETRMVAEGVATTRAAVALAARQGIEMPIVRKVHEILFDGRPARQAVEDLLSRPLKEEA